MSIDPINLESRTKNIQLYYQPLNTSTPIAQLPNILYTGLQINSNHLAVSWYNNEFMQLYGFPGNNAGGNTPYNQNTSF